MKHAWSIPTLFAITLSSCAQFKGQTNAGSYTATLVGTDADRIKIDETGVVIEKMNQSKSLMSAIRTIGTIASAWITNDMLKFVQQSRSSEVINGQNADVAKEGMKQATSQAQIKADAATEALKIEAAHSPVLP